MSNPWRGEVEIVIDGEPHVMRLTLGALAELEDQLGEDDLVSLVARFESGKTSARDILALIVAGLRGGGHKMTKAQLTSVNIEGGIIAAAQAAAHLLATAFAVPSVRNEPD